MTKIGHISHKRLGPNKVYNKDLLSRITCLGIWMNNCHAACRTFCLHLIDANVVLRIQYSEDFTRDCMALKVTQTADRRLVAKRVCDRRRSRLPQLA